MARIVCIGHLARQLCNRFPNSITLFFLSYHKIKTSVITLFSQFIRYKENKFKLGCKQKIIKQLNLVSDSPKQKRNHNKPFFGKFETHVDFIF